MYNYIISFLKSSIQRQGPFNGEFRRGYKNAWINKIKNYNP